MDPLVATLILISLALLGARLSFSNEKVPFGPRLLFRTGTHFLFLGALLGPGALGLVSVEALEQLFPLMALGLGWVGFLFGLQLERQVLRQFAPAFHWVAFAQAILAFGVFASGSWFALKLLGLAERPWTALVWTAAATACISTPAGIAMVSSNFLVRGPVRQLLFFVSSIDGLVGIVALQIIYSVYHGPDSFPSLGTLPAAFWLFNGLALGVVCAIIFLWLTRLRPSSDVLVLYLMGTCAFAAAAALRLHVSPLFVCVVMGVVVTNLSLDHRRIYRAVERWEKPLYVILLILAGALLDVGGAALLIPLAFAYALLRGFAKLIGGWAATRIVRPGFPVPGTIGAGLLPQAGISIAMALSALLTFYQPRDPDAPGGRLLFGAVVIGVVISELTGPFFAVRVLRRAGEISPAVEEALAAGEEEEAQAAAIRHSVIPPDENPSDTNGSNA